MFAFIDTIGSALSAGWQQFLGSAVGQFLSPILNLSGNQLELAMVVGAMLILPILAVMANMSWTRGTFQRLYGDIEGIELRKFMLLALGFSLIIGAYGAMRILKDGFFNQMVGADWIPRAKILSVIAFFVIMIIFSSIVDRFKKHQLFFVVCGFYSVVFVAIALADWFCLPELTMFPFSLIPGRFIGWAYYVLVESLGGILVPAVFWAFVVSTTTTNLAKKGFPIIFIGGQIGTLVGATFIKHFVHKFGHPITIICTIVPLLLLPLLIEFLIATTPASLMVTDQGQSVDSDVGKKKSKPGMMEGLRLIATRPYLIGVAVVSTIYEIVGTIIDFQFKKMAAGIYTKEFLTSYLASVVQALSVVSLLFAIFGTSFLVRYLGVRVCLLGYPTVIALCVLAIMLKPALGVFFIAMVSVKAFSYVLNNPVKELLYLPTSKDVKYKAKGFIDGLGGKTSKATGSAVTETIRALTGGATLPLLQIGGLVSLGIVGVWVVVAFVVGNTYHKLVKNKQVIE